MPVHWWLAFVMICLTIEQRETMNLNELSYYEIVEPLHVGLNGVRRNRRDLSTRISKDGKHLDQTKFIITGHGRTFELYLYKNTFLIPNKYSTIFHKTDNSYQSDSSVEHCYYQGFLNDREVSSVAMSTCNGLNGVITDEDKEEFVIERIYDDSGGNTSFVNHIMFNSRDVIDGKKYMCDVNTTSRDISRDLSEGKEKEQRKTTWTHFSDSREQHHRSRRANPETKYIELIAIIDNAEYTYYKNNAGSREGGVRDTLNRAFSILNLVDSYYKWLDTRVVVSHVIIWEDKNLVPVTSSAHDTMSGIEMYAKEELHGKMKLKYDHVHLIIYTNSWGNLAGLASMETMCSTVSGAVTRDISSHQATATTLAHEMGHSIGFHHTSCDCTKPPCVMAAWGGAGSNSFASCTIERYDSLLKSGSLSCFFNYPRTFYEDPDCGNGFVEEGEECDCGSEVECAVKNVSVCCDSTTCKLKAGAECSSGICCEDCKFKVRGTICRGKMHSDCDLEEHCTGTSEYCPDNFFTVDGVSCENATSYCYKGGCRTHDTQCEQLWGDMAMKGEDACFQPNKDSPTMWAGCGKNDTTDEYISCAPEDIFCGKLQCKGKPGYELPPHPILGAAPYGKRIATIYYNSGSIRCSQGMTQSSPETGDPTLTGSGVKCGDNSICRDQKCVSFSAMERESCDKPCLNGGVCNNMGNCHCPEGYACPYCEFKGGGGSLDSGAQCVNSSVTSTDITETSRPSTTKVILTGTSESSSKIKSSTKMNSTDTNKPVTAFTMTSVAPISLVTTKATDPPDDLDPCLLASNQCQTNEECLILAPHTTTCRCKSGYFRTPSSMKGGDNCSLITTGYECDLRVTNVPYTEQLQDENSEVFIELKKSMEEKLRKPILENIVGAQGVDVTGFTPGSVIVEFTVVMDDSHEAAAGNANPDFVLQGVQKSIENITDLAIDENYSSKVKVLDKCRYEATNNCDLNANCITKESSFYCLCKTGYTGNGMFCQELGKARSKAKAIGEETWVIILAVIGGIGGILL